MALRVNGKVLETDNEGFLTDPSQWDAQVAEALAAEEELELTDMRWRVVRYIRDHYEQHHSVPEARRLLQFLRDEVGPDQATRQSLYKLFPYGYGQQACKIAGMRKPLKLMLDV